MLKLGKIEWICFIILLVGGINSGFIGVIGWDVIRSILGHVLGSVAYIIIFLAAAYMIYDIWKLRQETKDEPESTE